jgi:hypothetical protein
VNSSTGAVSVAFAVTGGTATPGQGNDFTISPTSGVLNFANGETVKTFTVTVRDDSANEGNETVVLRLSNPTGGAALGRSGATLTIIDNDSTGGTAGTLRFSAETYDVNESAGTRQITVQRVNGSSGAVSVAFAVTGGTAESNDFSLSPTSGVLNFANGVTSQTITVNITNDSAVEDDETVVLRLSNPTGGAALGRAQATLTILDNDAGGSVGTLQFRAATSEVNEGAGTKQIIVERVDGSTDDVSVTFTVTGGTATIGQGNDFTISPTSGVLNFANGETEKTITIRVNNDSATEDNETVLLRLSNPTGGAVLGRATHTLTIIDNDGGGGGGGGDCATNVTSRVRVDVGAVRRGKSRFIQTVTITNVSNNQIAGPVSLVLDKLGKGIALVNRDGRTACEEPLGSPFINVDAGAALVPGEQVVVELVFESPTSIITYTPRVLAGSGLR